MSLVSAAICAVGLTHELYVRNSGSAYYSSLAGVASDEPEVHTELSITEETVYIEEIPVPLAEYPHVETVGKTASLDFEILRETAPDIIAWIRCSGTSLDYPVVQGMDNDYYLNHLPDGTKNKLGSIFLDYRNNSDFSDENSLIYGHHVKSGAMFGVLENYKEQAYYNAYPAISLYTPLRDYEVELLAGYIVDAAWESLPLSFADAADAFEKYIAEILRRSVFNSSAADDVSGNLVTLCTCTYDFPNARLILVGKLVDV